MTSTAEPNNTSLVMIADSDPYVRDIIARFVSDAGYRVSSAIDGYDALDNARKLLPTVLIADMMLPRLDGLALCRILKSDPATKSTVTVILLSSLSAAEKAYASGADAFVLKPLEKSKILKALRASSAGGNHE